MIDSLVQADPVVCLETLPTVVLDQICELLVADSRAGICSLSLTSLSCAAVSRRFRLRCIHLKITDGAHLAQDVKHLDAAIGPLGEYSSHLRQLKLSGLMRTTDDPRVQPQLLHPPKGYSANFEHFVKFPPEDIARAENESGFQLPPEGTRRKINDLWRPLSEFITRLSLKDLIYACKAQVPRCLLDALHQHSPLTRLHMHTFPIRSLRRPDELPDNIDADEHILLTSPCVTHIVFKYLRYHYGPSQVSKNAVLESILASIAPNLRHLSIRESVLGLEPEHQNMRLVQIPWHRPSSDSSDPGTAISKVGLKTLLCNPDIVEDVLDRIHVEELEVLRIQLPVPRYQLRRLVHVAEALEFKSLSEFSIMVGSLRDNTSSELDSQLGLLLRALPPLTRLELYGNIGTNAMSAIWDCHGDSLKTLELEPLIQYPGIVDGAFSLGDVRYSVARLSKLERLETTIRRPWSTEGGQEDVQAFRTLGQFPKLRRLVLNLDVSVPDASPPGPQETGSQLRASTFRDALLRSATDSSLSREIFEAIRGDCGTLEYLEIFVQNADHIGDGWWDSEAADVLSFISPGWICEKKSGREVTVREMEGSRSDGDILEHDFEDRHDLRAVWDKIWPGNGPDRRWDWSSFPLTRT
ncbi:hypothetical protein B0T10DRAFT_606693 [Thelonectria olida]|uniref:Uncharacterized protein n=1 Tax=Thelonectria olida TaxID=1576542 RepID=A0A9P9AP84_9HYPO|nr:hypothetical protein B0T10DRAFT_606693 [Thelonectria olida]